MILLGFPYLPVFT